MEEITKKVIDSYTEDMFSEQQVAECLSISPNRVRRILDAHNISRRSRSEASTYYHITNFGQKEFVPKIDLTEEDKLLKVAGIMLYWGEGTKERGSVALSNSDPRIAKLFFRFLRTICGIDENRLHVTLHYYEDHNLKELTIFWSEALGIPEDQFYKPFLHPRTAKGSYRNPSKYGTVSIQYSDKELLLLIKQWMNEYENLGLIG